MVVKHYAVTVTNLMGAKSAFAQCNSKPRAHQWLMLDTAQVTCKRCLKGLKVEALSDAQRTMIGA